MSGAGSCGTAGQDFAALGQETAELSGVFVVYMLVFVNAKLANFSALAVFVSVVSIESQVQFLLSLKYYNVLFCLEGQITVSAVKLGESRAF